MQNDTPVKKHINDFAWSPELVRLVDVEQYRKLLIKTNTGLPVAASTIHRTRLAANFPLSPTINPNFNYYSRPAMSMLYILASPNKS